MSDPAVREGRYAPHSWQTGATGPDQIHAVRAVFTVNSYNSAVACFPAVVGGHACYCWHSCYCYLLAHQLFLVTLLCLPPCSCRPPFSSGCLNFVALPAIVDVPGIVGMLLSLLLLVFLPLLAFISVASVPADPILTVAFTLYILYWTERHTVGDYRTTTIRLSFFPTIGISEYSVSYKQF